MRMKRPRRIGGRLAMALLCFLLATGRGFADIVGCRRRGGIRRHGGPVAGGPVQRFAGSGVLFGGALHSCAA